MTKTSLSGKRILVTRARKQAADLFDTLSTEGAMPIPFATIEIAPLEDFTDLDNAFTALEAGEYAWVIFTSVNGVAACQERLTQLGSSMGIFSKARVAAIGPSTAAMLQSLGVKVDFIPHEYIAERILPGLGDVAHKSILLPRAEMARPALAEALQRAGAIVNEIPVYHTLQPPPDKAGLEALRRGVDVITFTSSSTVQNFVSLVGPDTGAALVACIGPVTAHAAQSLGVPVHLVAREYTIPGLLKALRDYFDGSTS
jgi:uroporphyrinogen-III synthase